MYFLTSDSALISRAGNTTGSSPTLLHLRLIPRTFFLSVVMQGGGLMKKLSCLLASSGRSSSLRRRGMVCRVRWRADGGGTGAPAPARAHGEGIEEPSALLALSDTEK